MISIFQMLWEFRQGLAAGLLVTLKLCVIVWTCGIGGGSVLGVAGAIYPRTLGRLLRLLVFLVGGIPILVFLFWMHYPFQATLHVVIPPFYTAALTLSLVNLFFVAELIHQVLEEFPEEYVVAGQVCGMTRRDILICIQFPIVLRQVLPGLLTRQVAMLQASIFASLISVEEIFRVVQRINTILYRPVEIYSALALFFLAVCLPLNGMALWLRQRYTRNLSER